MDNAAHDDGWMQLASISVVHIFGVASDTLRQECNGALGTHERQRRGLSHGGAVRVVVAPRARNDAWMTAETCGHDAERRLGMLKYDVER